MIGTTTSTYFTTICRSLSSTVAKIATLVLSNAVQRQLDGVVFCADSLSLKTFKPSLNRTYVQCCIFINLYQQSVKDGNCVVTQSFGLDVCTLFGLHHLSRAIFYFIFRQLWHREISTKQPVLFVTVQTTHCWLTKPDSNPYFSRHVHSALLLKQPCTFAKHSVYRVNLDLVHT